MQPNHVLAVQLSACRDYMAANLGHIPEVRKIIRDIDQALKANETQGLRGIFYSPAGIPIIEVAIHGNQAIVNSRIRRDSYLLGELLSQLNSGVDVTLKKDH